MKSGWRLSGELAFLLIPLLSPDQPLEVFSPAILTNEKIQALELHKRRSIELAQLCQDQKRKDFEKQNELKEVEKLIRGKNDQLEEWKMRVKQFSDKTKKVC